MGYLRGGPDVSIMQENVDPTATTGGQDEEAAATETGDLQMILKEMSGLTQIESLGDKVSVNVKPEGISISVSGSTLFASGRADLRPDAVLILQTVAKVLNQVPNNVRIEGHTDDVTPNGTDYATNWELSSARSVAVVRYLTEVENVDAKRFSATAYSEFQPVVPNDSARARAQNRRSEILILYPPKSGAIPSKPLSSKSALSVAGANVSIGEKEGSNGVPKE